MSLDYQEKEEIGAVPDTQPEVIQRVTPVTPAFSIVLIVCIVLVWICQALFVSQKTILFGGQNSVIIAGFDKQFFLEGQYWRILTGAALHGGIIHLAFNAYALYVLGKLVEFLSNRSHLAIVFLLSVIGGGLMSLAFLPDPSIGASGGIIGFLGYLTAYGFKRRKLLSNAFLKNMLFNIGFIAVMGIFIIPNVDNFGHLGGLLVGLIYGFIQVPSDLYKDPRETGKVTKILGYVSLGIFILTSIFTIFLILLWKFYL
ncbi:MAG: rhomboid family intramembrane serine protease [Acidobacteriota bacterium]|jgi:rhomboid protease GluP|nr:rhomboid family intramembrane serine protease [Acidobacteriota bacterium]